MRVDALDPATRLACVKERAVGQVFDGVGDIGIGAHIGRILAAQFQPDADESALGHALDHLAAGHGAGGGTPSLQ